MHPWDLAIVTVRLQCPGRTSEDAGRQYRSAQNVYGPLTNVGEPPKSPTNTRRGPRILLFLVGQQEHSCLKLDHGWPESITSQARSAQRCRMRSFSLRKAFVKQARDSTRQGALRKLVGASWSAQVALRKYALCKLLCASCSAQVAPASWSLQVAPCKLLCASCSAQVALCKLLRVSCSAQVALGKAPCANWSVQVGLRKLLCATCSA